MTKHTAERRAAAQALLDLRHAKRERRLAERWLDSAEVANDPAAYYRAFEAVHASQEFLERCDRTVARAYYVLVDDAVKAARRSATAKALLEHRAAYREYRRSLDREPSWGSGAREASRRLNETASVVDACYAAMGVQS